MADKFFTWNSQGDFLTVPKSRVVNDLLNGGCAVGMIQEGGAANDSRAISAIRRVISVRSIAVGSSVGAFTDRCTNYVLSSGTGTAVTLATVGGGVAGRTAAALQIRDTLYVSWHSTASATDNSDTSQLLRECLGLVRSQSCSRVVIGGDFNTDKRTLATVCASAGRTRSGSGIPITLHVPPGPTHSSDNTLDYFVVIGTMEGKLRPRIEVVRVDPSDHNPVRISFP
ncbi:hypothetical protein [Azospirillum thermophilum]|uniref:hypothetical protein n=1 Tax=Azospirillum thermophilum TaxID=2202148 RepID=UPI0011B4C00F|nr:hypothetical protein [Azospirillum thermophilum]